MAFCQPSRKLQREAESQSNIRMPSRAFYTAVLSRQNVLKTSLFSTSDESEVNLLVGRNLPLSVSTKIWLRPYISNVESEYSKTSLKLKYICIWHATDANSKNKSVSRIRLVSKQKI